MCEVGLGASGSELTFPYLHDVQRAPIGYAFNIPMITSLFQQLLKTIIFLASYGTRRFA